MSETIDRRQIVARYEAGERAPRLAAEAGVSPQWLRKWIRRVKEGRRPPPPKSRVSAEEAALMRRWRAEGQTLTTIAAKSGWSSSAVRQLLKERS